MFTILKKRSIAVYCVLGYKTKKNIQSICQKNTFKRYTVLLAACSDQRF